MVWRRDRINVFSVMNVMITDLTLTSSGVRQALCPCGTTNIYRAT